MNVLPPRETTPSVISPWACRVLATVMAVACVCTVYLGLALSLAMRWPAVITLTVSMVAGVAVWSATKRAAELLAVLAARAASPVHFWPAVLLGVVLRVAYWSATFPAVQVSDGLRYWQLAGMLARGEPYYLAGHAYWPPGTPLIYAPFVRVLGAADWLPLLMNLASFVLCGLAMRRLVARLHLTATVAVVGVLLLALWPGFVMTAGQVSKETLLIALVCASFAGLHGRHMAASVLGGCAAGMTVLTQPSLFLLPIIFSASVLSRDGIREWQVARLLLFVAGMVMVVAPWTCRNYTVFGAVVPVSTNAGEVFHAGNQPAMVRLIHEVGGFIAPPVPPPSMRTNDLTASRWHMSEARRFVANHPADFAFLTFQRIVQILGDDSDSAFRSLRLTGKAGAAVYSIAKAGSNGWWLLMVSLMSVLTWRLRTLPLTPEVASLVLTAGLGTVSALLVNGLAEGAARHHMVWVPFYALTIGVGVWASAHSPSVASVQSFSEPMSARQR